MNRTLELNLVITRVPEKDLPSHLAFLILDIYLWINSHIHASENKTN